MRIVLTGGTGFIGEILLEKLIQEGHHVTLLTRKASRGEEASGDSVDVKVWDGHTLGDWADAIDGADAVINLAGESIAAKRWSERQKKKIIDSRVQGTKILVHAIQKASKKPEVLINSSAVGFYGNVPAGDVKEDHQRGSGFLADTCVMWEHEAEKAAASGVRTVLLRTGIVLGKGGGAMQKMIPPFKMYAGGPLGSGKQWFPWIHRKDVVKIILFALKEKNLSGPVNTTAPEPLTMKEFCRELGKSMNRPSWAPVPGFMLGLLLGEMSEMLLTGQKAVPAALLKAGFKFEYPRADQALNAIMQDK